MREKRDEKLRDAHKDNCECVVSVRRVGGFTLVEILIVIALISLLAMITVPALTRSKELARRTVCGANLHQMSVSLMAFAVDNGTAFPEGGRTEGSANGEFYFSDFFERGWKKSLYPAYIGEPKLCYCPSDFDVQPHVKIGIDEWDYWNYQDEDYCLIGYVYTPNQETVLEDDQGNVFPKSALQINRSSPIMADRSILHGEEYQWKHSPGDPQGGNWLGGDGHVTWKKYSTVDQDEMTDEQKNLLQQMRVPSPGAGGYEHWW